MNTPRSLLPRLRGAVEVGLARLTGDGGRYALLDQAMRFAQLSREAAQTEQLRRLRLMLAHAGATVPYWRDVFADTRFEPRAVTSVDDLAVLPVLTKEIVRREGDRLLSDRFDKAKLVERKTGGSTAEPLVFYASDGDYEAQMSLHLRAQALVGIWPGDGQAKLWGYNQARFAGNALAPLTGRLFFDAFRATPDEMDRWIAAMQRTGVASMYGYAVALHQFARHVAERGAALPKLRIAFSTAEKLFPEHRAGIEAGLGVRVIDLYGSHEVPRIASECLHGRMHTAPDAAVLEFVDAVDEEKPRMLLTSLQAWAQPFIRYDQGDTVVPVDGTCSCGLAFPLVAMEVGKTHLSFALPGGDRIHSGYFFKPIYRLDPLQTFQIRHVALDTVEILAVAKPGRRAEAEQALAETCARLAARWEGRVIVRPTFTDAIPKTPRGKQPVAVSSVDADAR